MALDILNSGQYDLVILDEIGTVTQMNCFKHGLQQGFKAQRGIEY